MADTSEATETPRRRAGDFSGFVVPNVEGEPHFLTNADAAGIIVAYPNGKTGPLSGICQRRKDDQTTEPPAVPAVPLVDSLKVATLAAWERDAPLLEQHRPPEAGDIFSSPHVYRAFPESLREPPSVPTDNLVPELYCSSCDDLLPWTNGGPVGPCRHGCRMETAQLSVRVQGAPSAFYRQLITFRKNDRWSVEANRSQPENFSVDLSKLPVRPHPEASSAVNNAPPPSAPARGESVPSDRVTRLSDALQGCGLARDLTTNPDFLARYILGVLEAYRLLELERARAQKAAVAHALKV